MKKYIISSLIICASTAPMSYLSEDIRQAIKDKNYEAVLQFLDAGGSPNAQFKPAGALENGEPIIQVAAYSNVPAICKLLLERGATVFESVRLGRFGYRLGPLECPEDDDVESRTTLLRNTIFLPCDVEMNRSKTYITTFLLTMKRLRNQNKELAPMRDIQNLILQYLADDIGPWIIHRALQGKKFPDLFFDCAVSKLHAVTITKLKAMVSFACVSWRLSPYHEIDIERDHGKEIRENIIKRLVGGKLLANGVANIP